MTVIQEQSNKGEQDRGSEKKRNEKKTKGRMKHEYLWKKKKITKYCLQRKRRTRGREKNGRKGREGGERREREGKEEKKEELF